MSKPYFLNPDGYDLHPNLDETRKQKKQIYTCHLDEIKPISFWDGKRFLQFNRNFITDLGSIPNFFNGIPGFHKEDLEISVIFHDNMCQTGGLWSGDKFIVITRPEADAYLRIMIPVEAKMKNRETMGKIVAPIYWIGVRIGAQFGYGVPKKK